MNLSAQRLRLLVYLTVGVGIVSYCIAEADWLLALLAIPAWAMSWFVCLGPHGKPLPRVVILAVVLSAVSYSVLRVAGNSQELVVSVARLMLWLQVAKLYDRWTIRDRGVVLVMSVFLVIGAILTSNSLLLGLALVAYLPLMVWTVLAHELAATAHVGTPAPTATVSRRTRRDLGRMGGLLASVSFAMAIFVFILVPRGIGEGFLGEWGAPAGERVSGFNDSVTLGAGGLISESRTPVLDVVLTNAAGVNIGSANRPLLLRGAVLNTYADGRWTRSRGAERRDSDYSLQAGQSHPIDALATQRPVYTLDVSMQRRPGEHLFTMLRPVAITLDRGGRISVGQSDLQVRMGGAGALRYSVRVQVEGGTDNSRTEPLFQEGRVRELAAEILAENGLSIDPAQRTPEQTEEVANALMRHLHENFYYTTQMTAADAGEDPIEMFLFRTKEGHCEYFASAHAAMCLSAGIDARVVTGYLAVEFNEDTGAYVVRESNAHAWVEVRLDDGQWVNFDPSPPEEIASVHEPATGLRAFARHLLDGVSRWWINSVVAFDESRRQSMVGRDPLGIEKFARGMVADSLLPTHAGGMPIIVTAILRGVVAFGVTAACGFIIAQFVPIVAAWRTRRRERLRELIEDPGAAERIEQREFYDEALKALRRAGLAKPRWRSMRDHADSLRRVDGALASAARTVADLYYASRYGRRLLTADELQNARSRVDLMRERISALRAKRSRQGVR